MQPQWVEFTEKNGNKAPALVLGVRVATRITPEAKVKVKEQVLYVFSLEAAQPYKAYLEIKEQS